MPLSPAARLRQHDLVCIDRLRPAQMVARRKTCPLAYLPLGVIEWHGPQNPLGLDGLKVHELCVRAAALGGGVVFPVPWYGAHRESNLAESNPPISARIAAQYEVPAANFARGYMGGETILEQANFYLQILTHCFHEIRSYGFEAIYCLSGHGPLKPYAVLAGGLFERATGVRVECSYPRDLVPGEGNDHAGRSETGTIMALCPELVDISALPRGPKSELLGINGKDPRIGSKKHGEAVVKACVPALAKAGKALLARMASDGSMKVE